VTVQDSIRERRKLLWRKQLRAAAALPRRIHVPNDDVGGVPFKHLVRNLVYVAAAISSTDLGGLIRKTSRTRRDTRTAPRFQCHKRVRFPKVSSRLACGESWDGRRANR
jgi:hypothetical protein